MREVCADIEIRSSPKRVWKALTGFSNYPVWNPFMRIVGELRVGARLQITIVQPGHKNLSYRSRITRVEPNRELRWVERGRIPWLLDSERIFTLEPLGAHESRLVQRQRFRGLLTPFVGRLLRDLKRLFEVFNLALKAQVERG